MVFDVFPTYYSVKKMQIYFGQESYRWSSMFFPLIIVILNINKNKEKNTTD